METNIKNIPRPEYPRPQFVRDSWINLNGEWDFEIDFGKSGKAKNYFKRESLDKKIIVPFCPESKLSGIEFTDFMPSVWYIREFDIPDEWMENNIILHFGAVDYATEVWINGESVGTHKGGYSSFSFDITEYVDKGTNRIVVNAEDDIRSGLQPGGKQSPQYNSFGCLYTRTTGIWQTVWLECVPTTYLKSAKFYPDIDNASVMVNGFVEGFSGDSCIKAEAFYDNNKVGEESIKLSNKDFNLMLKLSEAHLWEAGNPNLYDLKLSIVIDNEVVDEVNSYFGLRDIRLADNKILINNKPVFQRLVLDQGFYPDGIYTAKNDEALKKDIEISIGLGFNGARLHEKIFEPRFLYWADQLGYLVWGEHANWGLDITSSDGIKNFLPEWLEAVERDFNHPSIVGWCPFNETWDCNGRQQDDDVLRVVYNVTKALDKTRPVIDTSGNFHVVTDIYDIHDYEQDPDKFADHYRVKEGVDKVFNTFENRQKYEGQPYFVSEYGGFKWQENEDEISWGYGNGPETKEEFFDRYEKLTTTLLRNSKVCAFCYTQLYDVEQEANGLYTYDRRPKFDPEVFRKINTITAKIEEE